MLSQIGIDQSIFKDCATSLKNEGNFWKYRIKNLYDNIMPKSGKTTIATRFPRALLLAFEKGKLRG